MPTSKCTKPVRTVKTAPKAVIKAAIERFAKAHRDLIKDLAK